MAQESQCKAPEALEPRTHGPREKAFAVDCGSLRAEAIYWDRSIVLAAYRADGKPIEPDERALSAFGPLIARIVATQPEVGRWTLSVKSYDAFGPRLAAAVAADKKWDARRGRPREGHVNSYVLDLSNRARTFAEIERVAEANAWRARVLSVEKVLLCPSPAHAGERLPCGASIWFALTRE